MTKRVSVEIDEDLYQELVRRGGGPRKVSAPANALIRLGLHAEHPAPVLTSPALRQIAADVAALAERLADALSTAPPAEA